MLVGVADRPDVDQFPKCNPAGIPPETFYAFDTQKKRCTHMLSYDAHGIGIAWDTDRDGRYFLRTHRPLVVPRFVEYSYDYSNAQVAGEHWSHSHRNYRGSLGGAPDSGIGGYEDRTSPRERAQARKPHESPVEGIRRARQLEMQERVTKPVRKRLGGGKITEDHISGGASLDEAAKAAAESLTAGYGKKRLRKAK